MNILRILAIILVLLIVLYGVLVLIGPKETKIQRSIEIHAPRAVVFKQLGEYKNWMHWSPWVGIDTACKYDYFGQDYQLGAGYHWVGNDKVGEGKMTTSAIEMDKSMGCHLSFLKPWKSEADATFTLSGDDGTTVVVWTFSMHNKPLMRPMCFFMNMEKMLGPDYEKGLAQLKMVCEKNSATPIMHYEVTEGSFETQTYLVHREKVAMKDIGAFFQTYMPATFKKFMEAKLEMAGPPTGLYYSWDTTAKQTDMATAMPVLGSPKPAPGNQLETVLKSKAAMIDYYGSYDKMANAHNTLKEYLKKKEYKWKAPVIEQYIGDPGKTSDPDSVLTRIIYLYE